MNQNRFVSTFIPVIMVALIFGLALYLRIVLPYDKVFLDDLVMFRGNDPYFFLRQVDNLIHNYPHLMSFDPYTRFPQGMWLSDLNFWPYFFGTITWLFGLTSPTERTIDVVGVYLPAILGALAVIPVYFIGKELVNRWTGIIAAGLITIMPSEFLGRTMLGFADRDALEVLLTVLSMLFLILAIKNAKKKELTLSDVKRWHWAVFIRPLAYSFIAGIFLGMFLLTWRGAFLLVLIIAAYLIVQSIIDHLKKQSTDYVCIVGATTFLFALITFLPAYGSYVYLVYLVSLVFALLLPLGLSFVSWLFTIKRINPTYYPLVLLGLCLVSLAIFYLVTPPIVRSIIGQLSVFILGITELTVGEMQPILFPGGIFSLRVVYGNFTTAFFLSLISLGILLFVAIKRGESEKVLLVVWSMVMLAATLALSRLAVLFAVNVALLTGYLSWLILKYAGVRELPLTPLKTTFSAEKEEFKPNRTHQGGLRNITNQISIGLSALLIFVLVILPNVRPAITVASEARYTLGEGWYQALSWLKHNTPDPFGDPDFYYQRYKTPYHYPETAYGVVAWWDYGYHIVRISHRLPVCDPGGGARKAVASFFTAQDEIAANRIIEKLNSKYIIIDYATATTMFQGVITYAGSDLDDFYDTYQRTGPDGLRSMKLYHPQYYRSLSTRLYNFNGEEVSPQSTPVISYEEKISGDGQVYKEITDWKSFTSYEEAVSYIRNQKSGNHVIVGTNTHISPVPLESLEAYKLVYSSDRRLGPQVNIFEYAP
ncbi:oligosaccharyl transferase, archaeosortase A system-associated [Chloroflexota bacterium]